jgi:hypothetical protein
LSVLLRALIVQVSIVEKSLNPTNLVLPAKPTFVPMDRIGFCISLLLGVLFIQEVSSQSIDWYELVIIPEIKNAQFLVVEVDSMGMKCRKRDEPIYCTVAEEAHDFKLQSLREKQLEALKTLNLKWTLVKEDSLKSEKYKDTVKYPFIIDYDFDLIGLEKVRKSLIYLKLDFLLIDRKTNYILGRSSQYDLNDPFEPMELMIDELIEMNSSE